MTLQDEKLKLVKLHSQLLGTNGHECHSVSDCNLNFADALLEEVAKVVCPYCSPSKRWQPATFSEKFRDWVHIIGACEGEVPCSASAIRSGKGK